MIFFLYHFNASAGNFCLDIVAALEGDELVVLAMKDVDVAAQAVPNGSQVGVKFGSGSTYDVMEGMPCSIVCVTEKPFKQECSQPGTYYSNSKNITLL